MFDLNSLTAPDSAWTLQDAVAINDAGQIACNGVNSGGQQRPFLLTPAVPGDANLDGQIDVNDLTIVLANFGQTGTAWSQGNFYGDAAVDINDLTAVALQLRQHLCRQPRSWRRSRALGRPPAAGGCCRASPSRLPAPRA